MITKTEKLHNERHLQQKEIDELVKQHQKAPTQNSQQKLLACHRKYKNLPLSVRLELRLHRIVELLKEIPQDKIIFVDASSKSVSEDFRQFFQGNSRVPLSKDMKKVQEMLNNKSNLLHNCFKQDAWIVYATTAFYQRKLPLEEYITLVDYYNLGQRFSGERIAGELSDLEKFSAKPIEKDSLKQYEKNHIILFEVVPKTVELITLNIVDILLSLALKTPSALSAQLNIEKTRLLEYSQHIKNTLLRKQIPQLYSQKTIININSCKQLLQNIANSLAKKCGFSNLADFQKAHQDYFFEFLSHFAIPTSGKRIIFKNHKIYYLFVSIPLLEKLEFLAFGEQYIQAVHIAGRISPTAILEINAAKKACISHPVLGIEQDKKQHGYRLAARDYWAMGLHDKYHRQVRESLPIAFRNICLDISNEIKNLYSKEFISKEILHLSELEFNQFYLYQNLNQELSLGDALITFLTLPAYDLLRRPLNDASFIALSILLKKYPEVYQEVVSSKLLPNPLRAHIQQSGTLASMLIKSEPLDKSMLTKIIVLNYPLYLGLKKLFNWDAIVKHFSFIKNQSNQIELYFAGAPVINNRILCHISNLLANLPQEMVTLTPGNIDKLIANNTKAQLSNSTIPTRDKALRNR